MEKDQLKAIALAAVLFIVGTLVGTYVVAGLLGVGAPSKYAAFDDSYAPDIDPADFVEGVDNPYFPLVPGTVWRYEGKTGDGLERIEFRVLNETRIVMGVTCTVVRDTVTVDGEKVEDTYDWFAQDSSGNVWYFGEDSKEYEDGKAVNSAGSWEAGVDGAFPGIIMMGDPVVGMTYRQEYLEDEAEDMGTVLSLDETVTVKGHTYSHVLKTRDFTLLDPEVNEYKYYAPGVGVVMEKEGSERVELVELVAP
jgi:hypothetical protein